MSDEAPKSAYELAMERLRKKDAQDGVAETAFTEEQKAKIAEVKQYYAAKLAEVEILHNSKLATVWEPEERAKVIEQNRRDVQRLHDDRDRKLEQLRNA